MITKSVLKLSLEHEPLIRPIESEIVVIMEDIYDQNVRQDLLKIVSQKIVSKLHLNHLLIPI